MVAWLPKLILAVIRYLAAGWQREQAARAEGIADAVKESNDAADKREAVAKAAADDWDALSDDERERVRNDRGHYRD